MCPTIRIDDEVYDWLQRQAVPFDDTPNSVLRRVAQLNSGDAKQSSHQKDQVNRVVATEKHAVSGKGKAIRQTPLASGDQLIKRWKLQVRQARFHRGGHYYEHLSRFPAALCDPKGYVIFENENAYRNCKNLRLGQQVNVMPPGISSIPGYQSVDDPIV